MIECLSIRRIQIVVNKLFRAVQTADSNLQRLEKSAQFPPQKLVNFHRQFAVIGRLLITKV